MIKARLRFVYGGRMFSEDGRECAWEETRLSPDANITLETRSARLEDGLRVTVERTFFRDDPAAECVAYFENDGAEPTKMLEDAHFSAHFPGEAPVLIHGNGDTCREDGYEFFEDEVNREIALQPVDGTPCNGAFPYMRLRFRDYCVNAAVGWPAMWKASFFPEEGGAGMSAGQARCHMRLRPGERIRTPRLTLMAAEGGEDRARNMWRRWYMAHILPRPHGAPLPPKLCLHTFMVEGKPEFTGVTEQNQINGLDRYLNRGLKPDVWWIDAGWYPCGFDWPRTGTWIPNPDRLPDGLGPVGRHCDENGVELLLWFEPERVRAGTELDREHPGWLLHAKDADGRDDENRLLNLGDKACREWITRRVSQIIREGHVRVYRQDFNFAPRKYWEQNEAEDRVGATENLHAQGYLQYWDDLVRENPGLWIDSCASGGRRNDLETMRRAVPLHYTDVGYGKHPVKQKQHRAMFEWIPYFRAHTMSWDGPDGGYDKPEGRPLDEYAYHCAMAPAVTCMAKCDDPEEQIALARKMLPVLRRAAHCMLSGDYFPLSVCRKDPKDFYAMQFDDPVRKEGFIQIVRNTQCPAEEITVFPHAEAREQYDMENPLTGERMRVSGEELTKGLTRRLPLRSGEIWFYKRGSVL